MKKFLKAMTAVLAVVVLALALVGCSDKYGSIKKAYENEGYTITETKVSDYETQLKSFMNDEKYEDIKDCKLLVANKGINVAFVVTFGTKDDMKDFYGSEESYNSAVDAGNVNGNCMLLTMSSGAKDIFKKA